MKNGEKNKSVAFIILFSMLTSTLRSSSLMAAKLLKLDTLMK